LEVNRFEPLKDTAAFDKARLFVTEMLVPLYAANPFVVIELVAVLKTFERDASKDAEVPPVAEFATLVIAGRLSIKGLGFVSRKDILVQDAQKNNVSKPRGVLEDRDGYVL